MHVCNHEFSGQHAQAMVASRLSIAKLTMAMVYCRVKTPNYELYGAMTVDIRVGISGEGWTVNKIQFAYFANTSAKNCLAYGPGLLPQVVPICLSCMLDFTDMCFVSVVGRTHYSQAHAVDMVHLLPCANFLKT